MDPGVIAMTRTTTCYDEDDDPRDLTVDNGNESIDGIGESPVASG